MASLISKGDQKILHFSRAPCYPRTKLGCYSKEEKENRYWADNQKSWQQYLRERGDILYLERNRSLYVSLIRNEQREKNCLYAGFPVEFHREIRIVPLCMLSSSQTCCPAHLAVTMVPQQDSFIFSNGLGNTSQRDEAPRLVSTSENQCMKCKYLTGSAKIECFGIPFLESR